jgi:hypothetical protein
MAIQILIGIDRTLLDQGQIHGGRGGATAPAFETNFMLLSSDFSPKYCIFIVTAPLFCLTAPPFKNFWIRPCA